MKLGIFFIIVFAFVDIANAKRFIPKSFEADLEQVVFSITFNKEMITPVKMKYLFSNNLYFNVKSESTPVIYVCNKSKTWIYNPPFIEGEKGEVKVGDSSKYCYVKLFDALNRGLKSNDLYKVKLNKQTAELDFTTKATAQTQIKKVILSFDKENSKNLTIKDVKKMEFWDTQKKKPTVFRFKSIDTKAKLDFIDFEFKIPENTNVTKF